MRVCIPQAMVFIVALIFIGCKSNNTNETIISGDNIPVEEQTIPSHGGKIEINQPGNPINGLIINVPNASYKDDRKFKISIAEIKAHNLGPDFHPVSPLITIYNGGGYSDSVMTLSIPVNIPENAFAMAFLYDDQTGKLEGMPLLVSDGKRVVVATRNFDNSLSHNQRDNAAAQISVSGSAVVHIVVSEVPENQLQTSYNTGFKPGVDDCPFPNWGTSYSPRGQCDGQALGMLWYYTEKKLKGSPSLFGLLDNDGNRKTPKFGYDDVLGTKFAAIIQKDINYNLMTLLRTVIIGSEVVSQVVLPDRVTRYALCYAMQHTLEPQILNFCNKHLDGHAGVIYKIIGNEFYIADPNFPGDTTKKIIYDPVTKSFQPYISGQTAGEIGTVYTNFMYMAKSAMFSWPNIADHWKEVENKTIGKGKFPDYSVFALNNQDEFVPFEDGFEVPDGKLSLNVKCPGHKLAFIVYDANGNMIHPEEGVIMIPGGEQEVGVTVQDGGGWMGFKWVKVKSNNDRGGGASGQAKADLKINGIALHIDNCWFLSMGNSFQLSGPQDHKDTETFFSVGVEKDFHGVGEYNNVSGTWATWAMEPAGIFHVSTDPGFVKITRIVDGKVEGSFSFIATMAIPADYEGSPAKVVNVKVEGEFH